MRRLIAFLTNMDAKAWRTLAVSFVLFGGVGIIFLFGAPLLGLDGERTVESWLAGTANGPWALPVAVIAFAALAFLGVPQFALIAAAVVVFGPWLGFAYSWIGTLVSSLVGRSETITLIDGQLDLGEFGFVYFIDFDTTRARTRTAQITVIGE